jgi:bifunctional non-homologous end joining protein LigD
MSAARSARRDVLAKLGDRLVGYYSDDGDRLSYAGKVGTGYTREILLTLRERLDPLEQPRSPFDEDSTPTGEHVHWVKPRLVAEIAFGEWTQNGVLRQPRFEGLRPHECRRERPAAELNRYTRKRPRRSNDGS